MRIGRNARIYANRNHFVHKFQTISLKVLYDTDIHQLKDDNNTIKIMEEKIKLRDKLADIACNGKQVLGLHRLLQVPSLNMMQQCWLVCQRKNTLIT